MVKSLKSYKMIENTKHVTPYESVSLNALVMKYVCLKLVTQLVTLNYNSLKLNFFCFNI